VLGPSLLGRVAPELATQLIAPDVIPHLPSIADMVPYPRLRAARA
jgi:hypothetical protein